MSRLTAGCCVPLLLLAAAGCQRAEEVRTYEVPKEQSRTAVEADPSPSGPPTDRMIAAMLRGDESAWFFKTAGPIEQIEPVAERVHEFLGAVGFNEENSRPTWEAPDEWTEQGESGIRLATLLIPAGNETVEMSVIPLGLSGDWDAQVLDNVNRWRGQLGLRSVASLDALAGSDEVQQTTVDGRPMVVFDAQGHFESSGMSAPFAASAGVPPTDQPAPPERAPEEDDSPLSYTLPEGWQELPAGGMRLADLRAGGAEVTAFAFSSQAPAMADPLENVNRWRREIGMPPTDQQQLDDDAETLTIDGAEATYVELTPEGGAESTVAAMFERGPLVWFFKMRGPAGDVAEHKDAFGEWLASVKIQD